jgi:hypothetical protein
MTRADSHGTAKATVLTAAAVLARASETQRVTVAMGAEEAFEAGGGALFVQRVGGGVGLYDRNLVEDDGPGVGIFQPGKNAGLPGVKIGGGVSAKKVLRIGSPIARAAHLVAPGGVEVEINGRVVGLGKGRYPEIDVGLLRAGDNEVVLRHPGEGTAEVKVASREHLVRNAPERAGRAGRSFVSRDGGGTWELFDGEFMVRMHLVQYASGGELVSPVIDLVREEGIVGTVRVNDVRVACEAEIPGGTGIRVETRMGSTPAVDETWTDWTVTHEVGTTEHRFVQWRAVFLTSDPLRTPVLKRVTVEAGILRERLPAWVERVEVLRWDRPEMRYTSIPFEYEDPRHPRLVALREKWGLEALVAGASSELEKLVRIRNFVANRWPWTPPVEDYPDWDADEILTRRYGFCVQHAIAYMQCALAMGFQTRFVFGNNPGHAGHEVCETWSNEFGKWIYMDCGDNFHVVDRGTGVPFSMMELHDRIMARYYPDQSLSYVHNSNELVTDAGIGVCYGLDVGESAAAPSWGKYKLVDGKWELSRKWVLLRYMPRNNFYAKPYPVPICQGRNWDWSEYVVWQGPEMPAGQWQYGKFTARRADVEWTINTVRIAAAAGARAGVLAGKLATVTPYL